MKYFTLLIVIILFAVAAERLFVPETTEDMQREAVAYGEEHNKTEPSLPFRYDGCTLFPDKLPSIDLTAACYQHDIAYYHGGSYEERKAADARLKEAVAAESTFGQIMQFPVYIGVRLFGDTFLTRAFGAHWGFGHEE